MPKVHLTTASREESHADRADEALRIIVVTRMMRDGITQKEIAWRIGLTPVTFSRRLARPDTFTIGELRKLQNALGFTDAETMRCV